MDALQDGKIGMIQEVDALQGIKIWMIQKKVNASSLAKKYGCSESFMSQFLNKDRPSKKLVTYLTEEGCPEEYFKNGRVTA